MAIRDAPFMVPTDRFSTLASLDQLHFELLLVKSYYLVVRHFLGDMLDSSRLVLDFGFHVLGI